MTLRLHDTATRGVRDFVPVQPGTVSIYLCGATVQAPPHIGHMRSGVSFDILVRWLRYCGYDVVLCRNVTDIDDKVLRRAAEEHVPYWRVAQRNERLFNESYRLLGCLPPTVEPRATGHIPEMIALMRDLIDRGHAYAAGGDVYYDVLSFPEYGALSGQRLDHMRPAEDEGTTAKRDPRDFTLWKAAKPGEPFWDTPWGPGRPGWHLECSAMAHRYLGEQFDIHCGGVDLVFPHHENEIAQSKGRGDRFANYWLHNAWLTLGGEKMSKSLGNSLFVTELAKRYRPVVLRYYMATPHYRSTIEYSPAALEEAAAGYDRLEQFVLHATELCGEGDAAPVPADFAAAMDDDLGVPQALAVLHREVRRGNTALAGDDKDAVGETLAAVRGMLGVLGLDPLGEPWRSEASGGLASDLHDVVERLVAVALEARQAARARKDYQAADVIRDQLAAAGIAVEDTPQGTRWTLADRP